MASMTVTVAAVRTGPAESRNKRATREDRLVPFPEAARRLGRSPDTLRLWHNDDAQERIRTCETAADLLDPLAARLQQALDRLRAVPRELGEVYELVYEFIRRGGKLPAYGRWIKGAARV
jgi:hypothetical protein